MDSEENEKVVLALATAPKENEKPAHDLKNTSLFSFPLYSLIWNK